MSSLSIFIQDLGDALDEELCFSVRINYLWIFTTNFIGEGSVHKGRPKRRGRGVGQMRTGEEGGKGPCGVPQAGTFLYCFSMLCRHTLWMMPIRDHPFMTSTKKSGFLLPLPCPHGPGLPSPLVNVHTRST